MPYSTVEDLPAKVTSKVPAEKLGQFLAVFNDVFEETGNEGLAFSSAYSAVDEKEIQKALVDGKNVDLNKPFRLPSGSSKKFGVYVKDGDKVKKVTFGDPNMEIRRDDPQARANFRSRHSCDTQNDKTSAAYWSCRMWEEGTTVSELTKSAFDGKVFGVDEEQRIVWGWASVATVGGKYLVDRHGDVMTAKTMLQAANRFMEKTRTAKTEHYGAPVGVVLHSLPLTNEIAAALGIKTDKEGWIIGMKIYDDGVWEMVKRGEFPAFSIGGNGKTLEMGE